jgi:hypothetical protein
VIDDVIDDSQGLPSGHGKSLISAVMPSPQDCKINVIDDVIGDLSWSAPPVWEGVRPG